SRPQSLFSVRPVPCRNRASASALLTRPCVPYPLPLRTPHLPHPRGRRRRHPPPLPPGPPAVPAEPASAAAAPPASAAWARCAMPAEACASVSLFFSMTFRSSPLSAVRRSDTADSTLARSVASTLSPRLCSDFSTAWIRASALLRVST